MKKREKIYPSSTLIIFVFLALFFVAIFSACSEEPVQTEKQYSEKTTVVESPDEVLSFSGEKIPEGLQWLSNSGDPVFASPEAVKGGTLHSSMSSFPMTFRVVGPDSNGSFRSAILSNQYGLIGIHPNTLNIIPELATHWAFGKDRKTMYFKLNKMARWSDGPPVTAHDFAYALEFMRSKQIVAPWYNDFYTREIDRVIVYDLHTLAVVSTKAVPDLHLRLGLTPIPRHFYGKLDKNFVKKYNWSIVPNTGPYQIVDFQKGKSVRFQRKAAWWAGELKYYKNRFNVEKVVFSVVRDHNLLWEYFKKGKIDVFGLTLPVFWHVKSKTDVIDNGYANRIWFFNNTQQSAMGLWLNQDREIFKTANVRYAFAHAMNVKKVIERILRKDYFRLEHGFMGYGLYTNNEIRARRFDLKEVDRLMKASGWQRGADGIWMRGGQRFSVEVTYGFDAHTPRLVVLKEEAKKAGVELRLQKLDSAATFKKFLEKKHDVAWMGWSTSLRPQYWEHFHSANAHKPQTNNITNTDDPEMDQLIEAYRNSLEESERIDLSVKIQDKIHEIGSFVPTFMVPYVRQAYWRWWKLPSPPGTMHSDDLFDPFGSTTGGLFWYDAKVHEQTLQAMAAKEKFPPVTIVDETYKSVHEGMAQ
jgi:microcin C transport system substrate-binding protein